MVTVLVGAAAFGAIRGAQAQPAEPDLLAEGRQLYETGCISCHGADGRGVGDLGPTLIGVGSASVDFYLTSGRMPAAYNSGQVRRKPPAYDPDQIAALVAYVTDAFAKGGPEIPQLDMSTAVLSEGQALFTLNCAPCHNSSGAGGALGHAIYAPNVTKATPLQVAEAVRIGPGAMPQFGPTQIDDQQLASIVQYVDYLKHPRDRGGLPLGRIGPVPEGFVAWVFGIGAVLFAVRWLGARR
jgi:ubiquinol-cytochrome c reductase cytochrome c subunit